MLKEIEDRELVQRNTNIENINNGQKIILNYTGTWSDIGDELENGEIIDHGRLWEYLTRYRAMMKLANITDINGKCILNKGAIKYERCLELGSDWGHVFDALFNAFNDVYGIEPQKWAADRAKQFKRRVKHGVMEDTGFKDGFFDAVISNHVIEHGESLDVVIKEIGRITKSGGWGIHTVPCLIDGSDIATGGIHISSFNYEEIIEKFTEYNFDIIRSFWLWNHDQEDFTVIMRKK